MAKNALSLFSVSKKLKSQKRKGIRIGYKNAADVLPEEIIDLIRRYIEGEAIYIPKAEKRTKWGKNTGIRIEYEKRNRTILASYEAGEEIDNLAKAYCLSEDSIRKILKKAKEQGE